MLTHDLIKKLTRDYAVEINSKKYIQVDSLPSIIVTIKNWLKGQNTGDK